jgi:acyl dehydratase
VSDLFAGPVAETNVELLTHRATVYPYDSYDITEADIAACAELIGNLGAHHVSGLSGRQVAQGFSVAMEPLFCVDHGLQLRTMRLTFVAPVFAGDTLTSTVQVAKMHSATEGDTEVKLRLVITNQDNVHVGTGEATGVVHCPCGTDQRASR